MALIAIKETAELWANRAIEMSVSGLKTYIHEERKSQNVLTFQPEKVGKNEKNHENKSTNIMGMQRIKARNIHDTQTIEAVREYAKKGRHVTTFQPETRQK